jgi:hypothetical protein
MENIKDQVIILVSHAQIIVVHANLQMALLYV